jgi:hypothetical protein
MFIRQRWWRFAHCFINAAPEAHPKMTNDHRTLNKDNFFTLSEGEPK